MCIVWLFKPLNVLSVNWMWSQDLASQCKIWFSTQTTFCSNLGVFYKHELSLIWMHWPNWRCPTLYISVRWPTSSKWRVPERAELKCHITLPEDTSATVGQVICICCEWMFPSCTTASAVSPGTKLDANLTKISSDVESRSMWKLLVKLAHQ